MEVWKADVNENVVEQAPTHCGWGVAGPSRDCGDLISLRAEQGPSHEEPVCTHIPVGASEAVGRGRETPVLT